jgi:ketosteroid isomerase-like protein
MIKYDTYHDTWTNYLMEQESSPIQVQAEGDDAAVVDRTSLKKKKKDGPSKAMLRSILLSVLHV